MLTASKARSNEDAAIDFVDVLIVGAGLAGVDAAYRLQRHSPERGYAIFEARDAIGGTWDLFRYPGIRSDSDMHTLGFPFRPWRGEKAIADGGTIRDYVEETARTFGIDRKMRFGHRVISAEWSSWSARWEVAYRVGDERRQLQCRFLYVCAGYYDYDAAHAPKFAGGETFEGRWVHPQHWPEDLDVGGKRVAVIGSGATAITLVPALAARGAHVTMVQRSPSYIATRPSRDAIANSLFRWLPQAVAAPIVRWKNVALGVAIYQISKRKPQKVRGLIMKATREQLPNLADVDRHFTPRYDPWDQRVCLAPDGDLFAAFRSGEAEIVTDSVQRITAKGIELGSGRHVDADVIVSATGLTIKLLGGISMTVDGASVTVADRMIYKGMMLAGVPNMALAFGYTNASWTLKVDLTSRYVCRLLNHMRRTGTAICVPSPPAAEVEPRPMLDFSSGYVQRADRILPKQGSLSPWRVHQNYALDYAAFRFGRLRDGVMKFGRPGGRLP